ncbi:MAG: P1 family peptidase [Hyphomicrobiales bacterium]
MMAGTGKYNLITDVDGIRVGNAGNDGLMSGVSVVLPPAGTVAAVDVRGGGPATRETDALSPDCLVEEIHGLVLSGGSVFGLAAADGIIAGLAEKGVGFRFGAQPHPCPVVPSACLFDLINGGDKNWNNVSPYRALGQKALDAADQHFALGNHGAGLGALAGTLNGGLGSASARFDGLTIGALAAVNSFGSAVAPGTNALWASPFVMGDEFPAKPVPHASHEHIDVGTKAEVIKGASQPGANTTLCVVATDAALTKAQTKRLAIMAQDGLARALRPVHTPFDGDIVFALATRGIEAPVDAAHLMRIGAVAADCLARAIARGVWEARAIGGHAALRDKI